jgi:hypothetical protein
MSRSCPLCPVLPPPECVYSYLGLFRITQVGFCPRSISLHSGLHVQSEVEPSEHSRHLPSKRILRTVKWRFKFAWASGGEEFLSKDGIQPFKPWWSPNAVEESAPPNDNATSRWRDLKESSLSVLPQHLVLPFGMTEPDDAFPRGWLCVDCGQLNIQVYLRHRTCSNCQVLPSVFLSPMKLAHPYDRTIFR